MSSPLYVNLGQHDRYPICFEPVEALSALMTDAALLKGPALIVTDETVGAMYADSVEDILRNRGWFPRRITVPAGEGSKSAAMLEFIYESALSTALERTTPLIALGGGVVGDIAGFAASTLLRGIPLVQLPTTLLAMVDSSIGGKTGINHKTGKNLIGTFYQPRLVCCDTRVLETLPVEEWTNGLSEVIKHALISEGPFLSWITDHLDEILDRDATVYPNMIRQAAQIKARIVSEDEKETGKRAVLNYGHTFAHALESSLGYGTISHGQAVLIGMKAALALSKKYHPDLDTQPALFLLEKLPTPDISDAVDISNLMDRMRFDKKNRGGSIHFVLLQQLGQPYLFSDSTEADVVNAWREALLLSE